MANQVTFKINIDGNFREVSIDAKEFSGAMSSIKKASSGASGAVAALGKTMAAAFSVTAIIGGLKNMATTIADFERANSELASVLGTNLKGVEDLTNAAQDLGRKTEFTASQVTSLQTSLARLGFTVEQITDMQEPVMKFAAAVGTDLASAADFSGSALRAFGLSADKTGELLDIMAKSTSASALSFSKLQTSISIVGPVANAFGLKASEVTALLGVLSNAGFDASSAGTALRNILLNLADANGKLASGLGRTARTMPEIIGALKDITARGIDLNSALEMTDKRSVAAFEALVAGASDVEMLDTQLKNANGSLETMYATMTDNLTGAVRNLSSAWEGFKLQLSASKGPIRAVTQGLADMLNAITDAMKQMSGEKLPDSVTEPRKKLLEEYTLFGDKYGIELMRQRYQREASAAAKEYRDALVDYSDRTKRTQEVLSRYYKAKQKDENMRAIYGDVMGYSNATTETAYIDPVVPEGGGGDDGKFGKAISAYRKSIEAAVNINSAFGKSSDENKAKLAAMSSGLSQLIAKYGLENKTIQGLIAEYSALRKVETPGKIEVNQTGLRAPATVKNPLGKGVAYKSLENLKALQVEVRNYYAEIMRPVNDVTDAVGTIGNAFSALGDVVGESAGQWLEWAGNLMTAVAQAIPQIVMLTTHYKIKGMTASEAAVAEAEAAVAGIPIVGPAMAAAAGVSVAASLIAAIAALPKFAMGGIAYGPTLGLFGEYAGAASNPEVVAPLDRLPSLLGDGWAGIGGEVDFRISADALYGVLKRKERKLRRG